jgi:hypothetical protein
MVALLEWSAKVQRFWKTLSGSRRSLAGAEAVEKDRKSATIAFDAPSTRSHQLEPLPCWHSCGFALLRGAQY